MSARLFRYQHVGIGKVLRWGGLPNVRTQYEGVCVAVEYRLGLTYAYFTLWSYRVTYELGKSHAWLCVTV